MRKVQKAKLSSHTLKTLFRVVFWFSLGAFLGLFFFFSFIYILYKHIYSERIYPGVYIDSLAVGGKTKEEVASYFDERNQKIADTYFSFTVDDKAASISAKELEAGFDRNLMVEQAYLIGRSSNFLSDVYLLFQAYTKGMHLDPSYHYNEEKLKTILSPIEKEVTIQPVNAVFTFENGKVTEFIPHSDGQEIDKKKFSKILADKIPETVKNGEKMIVAIQIPTKIVKPEITTENVNTMGIKELIGKGTSLFAGSIPNRIFNIKHASSRLNGVLIPPNSVFSFAKAIGDISAFTGYKQAYVIENGRTVLGDGGGVCQVSTTLFRAILDSGFPIIERNPHAYRVHYYEEDSGPGIDAAVYVPSVDLKFKNDSSNWLLIQAIVDEAEERLTFELYGTRDGREVTISEPVILSQTPPPPPINQDDPTLPKGTVKQVDFAAWGAKVYFTREVKKDGKVIIQDRFNTSYRPWQAIFLNGTKEG